MQFPWRILHQFCKVHLRRLTIFDNGMSCSRHGSGGYYRQHQARHGNERLYMLLGSTFQNLLMNSSWTHTHEATNGGRRSKPSLFKIIVSLIFYQVNKYIIVHITIIELNGFEVNAMAASWIECYKVTRGSISNSTFPHARTYFYFKTKTRKSLLELMLTIITSKSDIYIISDTCTEPKLSLNLGSAMREAKWTERNSTALYIWYMIGLFVVLSPTWQRKHDPAQATIFAATINEVKGKSLNWQIVRNECAYLSNKEVSQAQALNLLYQGTRAL